MSRVAIPTVPLIVPDGSGGWQPTEAAASCSREQVAAWCQVEAAKCKKSPLYLATTYCHAVDLQEEDDSTESSKIEVLPQWPHVAAVIDAMFPVRNVIVEKSRRMLVSWTAMAGVVHDLLFERNWVTMTLSRVEDLVDDGGENSTWNSLHGKVRHYWNHLPPFLKGWHMEFKHLSISNLDLNTHLQGFSSSQSPGRSGGFNRAILDEFAWVTHSEQIMASVTMACPNGKMLISTPHGKGNAFYRIREIAKQAYPPNDEKSHAEQVS